VTDNSGERKIDELNLTVAQSPGAGNIDLNQTTVELVGTGGQESFELGGSESNINIFTGSSGDVVLTSSSDRADIGIVLGNTGYDNFLEGGDSLSVTFTTPSGATTTAELRVPTTLTDEQDSVRL
jgi:archaellin